MLNKLEKKFGKYAINNLIFYLLAGYGIGYLLEFGSTITNVDFISFITLEPYKIIHGFQIWRLVTWIMVPPPTSLIAALIMIVLYYQLGIALERAWGTFRFNLYVFGGMFFTVIAAFLVYAVFAAYGVYVNIGSIFSTYYICMTIFLAFALSFPDMQVLLYFIIPVKMKWAALIYLAFIIYDVVRYISYGIWFAATPILAAFLNFLIFYFLTKNTVRLTPKELHRRREFRKNNVESPKFMRDGSPVSRHKCAVCGRTEITNPELEFRFCSKCNGNYEYCSDHLFTHQHIK